MRRAELVMWAAVLALLLSAPLFLGAYNLSLLSRFLAMGILAMGISLVWGDAGILPLGQGLFFGLGAYAVAMHLKLSALGPGEIPDFMQWDGLTALPWLWVPFKSGAFSLLAALVIPAAVAGALGWLLFHRRVGGVYFAIITQALVLAGTTFIVSQQPYTGGFNGLTDFRTFFGIVLTSQRVQTNLYFVIVAILALCYAGMRWLLRTHFGKLLRAIRDGENRVRFLGYDPAPFKVAAFAIGAAMAGIAGVLFTLNIGVISPAMIGVMPSIEMVVWVAVGGRESLVGAVLGTLLVNFGKDQVSSAFPQAWLFVMGGLFILVVTAMPEGLGGLFALLERRPRSEARTTMVITKIVASIDDREQAAGGHSRKDASGKASHARSKEAG
ncbi:MAG: urea ABC transporter permease subunit UrtC [Candidatus Binataceae bacterium]